MKAMIQRFPKADQRGPLKVYHKLPQAARRTAIASVVQTLGNLGNRWSDNTATNRSYRWDQFVRFLAAQDSTPVRASLADVLVYPTMVGLLNGRTHQHSHHCVRGHRSAMVPRRTQCSLYQGDSPTMQRTRFRWSDSIDFTARQNVVQFAAVQLWVTQLAARMASRLDEVIRLTRSKFNILGWVSLRDIGKVFVILLQFGADTKSTAKRPFRLDATAPAIFHHQPEELIQLITSKDAPFQHLTTQMIRDRMHRSFSAIKGYGGHSFKKLAFEQMTAAFQRGIDIPMEAINILMKHAGDEQTVKDMTLRYGKEGSHWNVL